MLKALLPLSAMILSSPVAFAAAEAGKDAKSSMGLPQMDISTFASQIFWLALTFTLMYSVFRFKILPNLSGTIEERRKKIEGDLEAARDLKDEAQRVHDEYEAKLTEARQKSSTLYAHVEDKIKARQEKAMADFQDKSAKMIASTEAEIAAAQKAAMADMNSVAVEVSAIAAEHITGIQTDSSKVVDIVDTLSKKKAA